MRSTKFLGPIEEVVGRTCPGASYCSVDKCFREGKTCGGESTCCLDRPSAEELIKSLGCSSGTFSSPLKLKETSPLQVCSTKLGLTPDETSFLCLGSSLDECLQKMCDLGCDSPMCPRALPGGINMRKEVCKTVQQYCDVLDPSLLTDPAYNDLCCKQDLIAGIPIRTECGCPGKPCAINPKIQELKLNSSKYWATNQSTVPSSTSTSVPSSSTSVHSSSTSVHSSSTSTSVPSSAVPSSTSTSVPSSAVPSSTSTSVPSSAVPSPLSSSLHTTYYFILLILIVLVVISLFVVYRRV